MEQSCHRTQPQPSALLGNTGGAAGETISGCTRLGMVRRMSISCVFISRILNTRGKLPLYRARQVRSGSPQP